MVQDIFDDMSVALLRFVFRSRHPLCEQILRNIITIEAAVLLSQRPQDVHSIIADMHCIFACMAHVDDWCFLPRLTVLMHRARHIAFRLCHALIHRCAELVDACDRSYGTCREDLAYELSYDNIAQAVCACDDVWFCMVPSQKAFFRDSLKPRLVSFMTYLNCSSSESSADDDVVMSSSEDSDEFSDEFEEHDWRHIIRVRWSTANIIFEYERFVNSASESISSSIMVADCSDSVTFGGSYSVSPAIKRSRHTIVSTE